MYNKHGHSITVKWLAWLFFITTSLILCTQATAQSALAPTIVDANDTFLVGQVCSQWYPFGSKHVWTNIDSAEHVSGGSVYLKQDTVYEITSINVVDSGSAPGGWYVQWVSAYFYSYWGKTPLPRDSNGARYLQMSGQYNYPTALPTGVISIPVSLWLYPVASQIGSTGINGGYFLGLSVLGHDYGGASNPSHRYYQLCYRVWVRNSHLPSSAVYVTN